MAEAPAIHHAYLLAGERQAAERFLNDFWKERGVKLYGSPDFFLWQDSLFGIDDARKLSEYAARRAFTGKKIFFIAPEKITPEAQNALLKTFEDPIENTHFFLSVREEELILPTLRSRMQVVKVEGKEGSGGEAKKFLSMAPKQRLAFAKKFAEDEKSLSVFLDSLMLELRRAGSSGLSRVYEARRYSDDNSASARLVLEHLSLCL